MADEGNEKAQSIINDVVHYTGVGLVNMINIISPERVIISGGISNAPDHLLLDPLNEFVTNQAYVSIADKLSIETSVLGDNAPLIGAFILYKQ